METSWTSHSRLRLKLVVGFIAGLVVLVPAAWFWIGGTGSGPDEPGPGVATAGVTSGWCLAYPVIVYFVIRPAIQRYQQSQPD